MEKDFGIVKICGGSGLNNSNSGIKCECGKLVVGISSGRYVKDWGDRSAVVKSV
jgi:hypothetical protein